MSDVLPDRTSKIFKQVFIEKSLGIAASSSSGDWKIYLDGSVDEGEDDVSNIISLISTTGVVDFRDQNSGAFKGPKGLQIIVRHSEGRDQAYEKLKTIQDTLETQIKRYQVAIGINQYTVHSVSRTSDAIYMGVDPTNRSHRYSVNYLVTITLNS